MSNASSNAGHVDPVFIGGTGRSGTTILGSLLGHHPEFAELPLEIRYHIDRAGILALLTGRATLEDFTARMRGHFYRRLKETPKGVEARGLHTILDETALDDILLRFEKQFPRDPLAACADVLRSVLEVEPRRLQRSAWVESTPGTLFHAHLWRMILPEVKFVHVIRDGRDAAASVKRQTWGPSTCEGGLKWWAERLRHCWVGTSSLPDDRLMVINFEELVRDRRDDTYSKMLSFLGVDDAANMREYFDTMMTADAANLGCWAREVPAREQPRFLELYESLLVYLQADGIAPWLTAEPLGAGSANLRRDPPPRVLKGTLRWLRRVRGSFSRRLPPRS